MDESRSRCLLSSRTRTVSSSVVSRLCCSLGNSRTRLELHVEAQEDAEPKEHSEHRDDSERDVEHPIVESEIEEDVLARPEGAARWVRSLVRRAVDVAELGPDVCAQEV